MTLEDPVEIEHIRQLRHGASTGWTFLALVLRRIRSEVDELRVFPPRGG